MELLNATSMAVQAAPALDPDGRERLVVAVKGTFALPLKGGTPQLLSVQEDVVLADVFEGEPGLSATVHESELAPHKPRCDVLLNGSAHAPGGKPTPRTTVGLRVGAMTKGFVVVGRRHWASSLVGAAPSDPLPFLSQPISYGVAYGGADKHPEKPNEVKTFAPNPIGVGHYPLTPKKLLDGKPLPNTEEVNDPVKSFGGAYRPMSFGAVGRNFAPRAQLAGTYDERWREEVCPFLPADFDARYFQSAPEDQQLPYPRGGEPVVLHNLTPGGNCSFALPSLDVPVELTTHSHEQTLVQAVLDTIFFEPDQGRFSLTYRASFPLRKSLLEVAEILVGRKSKAWYRARDGVKEYYASLRELPDPALEPEPAPGSGSGSGPNEENERAANDDDEDEGDG